MIKNLSELLTIFINEEVKKLESIPMPHMPTLGSAYEALTKDGLLQDKVIPDGFNLTVVAGFVTINGVMQPEQIDCMLVTGEGVRYGRTDQYIYDIEQILCIFEVKKTLTKNDLKDAIGHLSSLRIKFAEYFEDKIKNQNKIPDITYTRRHFAQITGREAPAHYYEINNIPAEDGLLFYCLTQEMIAPLNIIQGYGGYKTEYGLRKAFCDILEEKMNDNSNQNGVLTLPSLITSNEFSLVKAGGMPFIASNDDKKWVPIVTVRHNPIQMILELLWSKISHYFRTELPWDDDIYMENLYPLLVAEPKSTGWIYHTIEFKEADLKRSDDNHWEPALLNEAEIKVINLMAFNGGFFKISDENSEYLIKRYDTDVHTISESLQNTKYLMISEGYLTPINNVLFLLETEKTIGYIASNKSLFDIWCTKNKIKPQYTTILKL